MKDPWAPATTLQPDPAHPGRFTLVHRPSLGERFLLELALGLDGDTARRQAVLVAFWAEHKILARDLARNAKRMVGAAPGHGFRNRRRRGA